MKITESMELMSMDKFIEGYRDQDFLKYCKECRNYNKNWACPPLSFDPIDYLNQYENIEVYLIKMEFNEEEIEDSRGKDLGKYSYNILKKVKNSYCEKFLKMEDASSKVLYPGSCSFCETCARVESRPCIMPEKLRYSMDSFGFNLGKLTTDLFGLELLWGKDSLPKYYSLIYGYMY